MRLARMAPFTRRTLAVALAVSLAQVPLVSAAPPDEQLELGVKQAEGGEFDAAVVTLDGVVRRLATSGREPKDLTRAYTYLAIAYLGLAQEQSAKARFLDALRAEPGLKLDPGQFPPKVIQFFEQVRSEKATAAGPSPAASPSPAGPTAQPAAKPATTTAAAPPEEKKGGSKALLVLLGVGAAAGIGLAVAGGGGDDNGPNPTTGTTERTVEVLSATRIAIPDANTAGITSAINFPNPGTIVEVAAIVNISHPFIGDLTVDLLHPDGTRVALKPLGEGGAADNIHTTYTPGSAPALANLAGKRSEGSWRLAVADRARFDVGTLDSWSLRVRFR